MNEAVDETEAVIDDCPAEPAGFAALRDLLLDPEPFTDEAVRKRAGHYVRSALNSPAFERAILNPASPPVARLRRLAELQRLVEASDLRPCDREEAMVEIDRGGMRVIWAIQLVDTVVKANAPPEQRAAALLSLIARGLLPAGACAKAALEPAKTLLATPEAHEALARSQRLKTQILDLLEAAEVARPAA